MKKIISVFLLVIALSLTACGGSEQRASKKAIACANEAIEVAEAYLAYDIDYDEASERMDELKEDMEYVSNMSREDEHYMGDFLIECDIVALSSSIAVDNSSSTDKTYESIQEHIEKLKEAIK